MHERDVTMGCWLATTTSHQWASAVESHAGTTAERLTSVHAATTPKHNSSSYKAQEARPGEARARVTTVGEDRLR